MKKKVASISLIIAVNILLSAFAATAHHHHHGIPHLAIEGHDHNGDDASNPCCSHGKDSTCLFEQDIIDINENEEHCTCFLCFTHNYPDEFAQAVLPEFIYDFPLPEAKKTLQQFPYLITYHSLVASAGMGLRAPPMV
jgi:hypothetical protein